MGRRGTQVALLASGMLLAAATSRADQTALGPWNGGAEAVAQNSALATSALAYIKEQAASIQDPAIRRETEDAVFNRDTCVRSRAGLTPARKQEIVDRLVAEGLVDPEEGGRIPGGLVAGVFPGLRDDGTDCPKLPQPYLSAPGSVFGGHHSQPGGLPVHVAVNLTSAIHLADTYRKVYGTPGSNGLPAVRSAGAGATDTDGLVDQDIAIGTPIWHDWAKTMVFQWNADGSEYAEMNFGGNGKTDAWGAPGASSKTGGHHLIGVAEGMARGMPPAFLIAHASAHGAPNAGNEHSVVNWLRYGRDHDRDRPHRARLLGQGRQRTLAAAAGAAARLGQRACQPAEPAEHALRVRPA